VFNSVLTFQNIAHIYHGIIVPSCRAQIPAQL